MEGLSTNLLLIIGTFFITVIGVLIFLVINKSDQVNTLQVSLGKLRRSFNELDAQAKLIVKTDLELNKAQEELDKRLHGLEALQKTSRVISTTLDEKEIFTRLEQTLLADLGFEKGLILTFGKENKMIKRSSIGFSDEEINFVSSNLEQDVSFKNSLVQGQMFSSLSAPDQRKEAITRLFDAQHFIISPILTKNGTLGTIFLGNRAAASIITEGDAELISILANQIGQSIENAQLFEEVFRSRQGLETKVHDRTKQLATALEEVQKISKTKSEFISAVSHELRTPLTSIKGYAALLISGKLGEIPEKVKERLQKINTHSDNLVTLINNLLDISRIESGRVEMSFKKHDVKSIIDNVYDLLTPQMKTKNLQWSLNLPDKCPEVVVDVSQFERVFINLVSNAIKFTPENGTISIQADSDPDKYTFHVADTGIGISESDLLKLFDEFYRVDNQINQSLKGTGLGLPLAKKIVEAHEGKMWVTSKVNEGTTFHFTLPYNYNKIPASPTTE